MKKKPSHHIKDTVVVGISKSLKSELERFMKRFKNNQQPRIDTTKDNQIKR